MSPSSSLDSPPLRLLIIDDNPSIHRDFDLVLSDELANDELEREEQRLYGGDATVTVNQPAYNIDHAFSGLEGVDMVAKALAAQRPYQVSFVDIRMPGIDGVETIERLWKVDPRVQIVICTAFADYSWDDLARRLGPTDNLLVLKKPFDSIEVTQLASTLTRKWFLARQAALKLEQMELLVARRTEKLLALQHGTEPSRAIVPKPGEPRVGGGDVPSESVILVAGDAAVRDSVAQSLGGNTRILSAEREEQAWRQVRETVPDLVVASARGSLNALNLCRRLKADELVSHVPVLVLAAASPGDLPARALEAGADDCIVAPVEPAILQARVQALLSTSRNFQEPLRPDGTIHPRDVAPTQLDAAFLQRAIETVEKHLSDYEFDVDTFAHQLAMSRRQLFRKLKAITGTTPNHLIRALRLRRAAQLLHDSGMTVTEITYAVGFADLKHFREVFREQFGVLPGEYMAQGRRGISRLPADGNEPG